MKNFAAEVGVALTPQQEQAFTQYAEHLLTWNERMNLTAITEPEEVQIRHFADSLSVLRLLPPSPLRLIDVGSGAGFPGLPLKIVRPEIELTLVDSVSKKVRFLADLVEVLRLEGVTLLDERAETLGQAEDHRERYDIAVARALAHLPTLVEYLLPLVRVGGQAIAMKGPTAEREAAEAAHALKVLGGRVTGIEDVHLPSVDDPHTLILIEKISPTPTKYPRRVGIPSKRPL